VNDQVELVLQDGRRLPASVIHVFTRQEAEGAADSATVTFRSMALLLYRKIPSASRVALITHRSVPLFLVEAAGAWWDSAAEQPIQVVRAAAGPAGEI
jgi:hypothetical protein